MNDAGFTERAWSRRGALTTLTTTAATAALGATAEARSTGHGHRPPLHDRAEQTASGRLYELRSGHHRAVVGGVAASLLSWQVAGTEMLLTHPPEDVGEGFQGKTILPWPNRIDQGTYEFDGERFQVPINEPSRQSALHGLMNFVEWGPVRHRSDSVTLRYLLHPQYGYPFRMEFLIEYTLDRHGPRCTLTAENTGDTRAPVGWANHTYIAAGAGGTDGMDLRLPAKTYYRTNDRLIPTGTASVSGTEYDFRDGRTIGSTRMDTAFTDLSRNRWGHATVRFGGTPGPDVLLWVDESYGYLQVYTDDSPSERRPQPARSGITVEPNTCPPNAFVTGESVLVLRPGQRHTATWGLRVLG
ncbi:aldose 1-epimerase [Actinopolyspora xinjiangensis]|uniref:Aldose 1-epimerase n=1 Tax=Actinopolyspora xinjiangensis TaxID=405564 RepID=A0A1H0WUI1_9ACTN|nr:aldose 1-epimerase family protein [Actinopolyspora xinjiangensis]SDP94398.1 aldose 1-epimerase [Actinopolyspora xinjiangensis]